MKFLALTTLLLTTIAAHAQSSTATIPTAPATNVSAIAAPEAAKQNALGFKIISYNATAPITEGAKDGAFFSENDLQITKKLDAARSLRLDVGFVKEDGYDYNGGGTKTDETFVKDIYLQYANTKAYKIGKQDLAQTFRVYAPTSQLSLDRGAFLPQARYYLTTDFAITEKFTISPVLNLRGYFGDASYTATNKVNSKGAPVANGAARAYYLVDFAYAFNDTFSITIEPAYINLWNYRGAQTSLAGFDNSITAQITKDFAVTLGVDGYADTSNNRKLEYTSNLNEYYANIALSL